MSFLKPQSVNLAQTLPFAPWPDTQARSSTTFKAPPLDGSLTVPEMYDWHYSQSPEHPVFVFPDEGSTRTIKWHEVVQAVHTGARLLYEATGLGISQENPAIVAIFAASDPITYFVLIASAMRAGLVPFLLSPRNSSAAVAHLLSITGTSHVLVGSESALHDILDSSLKLMEQKGPAVKIPGRSTAPRFEDLFTTHNSFDLLTAFRPPHNNLAVILHSSGTTSYPKPIGWTHLQLIQLGLVPYFGERDLTGVRVSYHAMPMFHGMGMMQTVWTATMGIVITAAKPSSPPIPPTPENVLASARAAAAQIIFCVPTFIEAWSRDPATMKYLSSLDGVLFGGGPLSKKVGDSLARKGVRLFILYGCTEIGIASPILPREPGLDWEYFPLTRQLKGKFVPNGDGQYELVLLPGPFQMLSVFNGKLDGKDAYFSGDLFVAHPSKYGYYKVFGRADDQIMHSTGEKTNPGPLEAILNQDSHVHASVMFGRERFNAGVLIEPNPNYSFDSSDAAKLADYRNTIWPTVERMNEYAPQHSRLFKEMILVASPRKPFNYTGKDTPSRQAIITNYAAEIETLYRTVAETTQAEIPSPALWDVASSRQFVMNVVHQVLRNEISDTDDLFQHGCDSLQATWIRNPILRAIRDSAKIDTNDVAENFVYQHPTIQKLAIFAAKMVSRGKASVVSGEELHLATESMAEMVERFTGNFPTRSSGQEKASGTTDTNGDVFLVVGTTGSLGASLLSDLLRSQSVGKVFALNRGGQGGASLLDRQKLAFQNLGLPFEGIDASERLVLLEVDASTENAGLTSALLDEIRLTVTHIIANAWPVDFNLALRSFEPSIKTVRNLIDIALTSYRPKPPAILFVSSVGVLARHKQATSALEVPAAADEAEGLGYSQSKWVGESILLKAAACTPLRVAIVRVGQLSGGANGYWKSADWVPSLVKSSQSLGCFPIFEPQKIISWVPVDTASLILLELAYTAEGGIFHLVHPKPVPYSIFSRTISSGLGIPLVPYSDWLGRLEEKAKAVVVANDLHDTPALRMLHFFRGPSATFRVTQNNQEAWGMPKLDMSQSCTFSNGIRGGFVRQISDEEVYKWLQSWRASGFL